MKFAELLSRIDLSKANRQNSDITELAKELLNNHYIAYLQADARYKEIPFFSWFCTDTHVGYMAHYLNDIILGVSYQSARKSDVEMYWIDDSAIQRMRDYCIELYTEEMLIVNFNYLNELMSLDKEIGIGSQVDYGSQLLTDKVIHKETGEELIVKDNYGNKHIGYSHKVLCQFLDGTIKDVEIDDIIVPYINLKLEKNMETKLTLDIIRSYNLPMKSYKPDYDDACYLVTLPNGIELTCYYMCNGDACDSDSLEGLDGWIYIKTKEELDNLISKTYYGVLNFICEDSDDFPIDDYR